MLLSFENVKSCLKRPSNDNAWHGSPRFSNFIKSSLGLQGDNKNPIKMKKFTLSIILACLVGGTAMAQTFNFVERASLNLNGHLSSIPPVFSYGNHSEFYTWNEIGYDEYSFSVLDENFEVKNSFTTQCIVVELNINGVLGDNPLHLTQTLFNNDEKCEYLRGTRNEEGKTVGFSIVSEDGTVLKEVSFNFAIDYCYPTVFFFFF